MLETKALKTLSLSTTTVIVAVITSIIINKSNADFEMEVRVTFGLAVHPAA